MDCILFFHKTTFFRVKGHFFLPPCNINIDMMHYIYIKYIVVLFNLSFSIHGMGFNKDHVKFAQHTVEIVYCRSPHTNQFANYLEAHMTGGLCHSATFIFLSTQTPKVAQPMFFLHPLKSFGQLVLFTCSH